MLLDARRKIGSKNILKSKLESYFSAEKAVNESCKIAEEKLRKMSADKIKMP